MQEHDLAEDILLNWVYREAYGGQREGKPSGDVCIIWGNKSGIGNFWDFKSLGVNFQIFFSLLGFSGTLDSYLIANLTFTLHV